MILGSVCKGGFEKKNQVFNKTCETLSKIKKKIIYSVNKWFFLKALL